MDTTYLTRARKLFNNPLSPEHTNRHNQRQWIKAIRILGPRWLLATKVGRMAR